jgi:hypothetical protein
MDWRKNPTHQGGFLLGGGIHSVAGSRIFLGASAKPIAIFAYTTLPQPHLPSVDTVNSIWVTKSGVSGTVSMSFGTTFNAYEYNVACEKGTVMVLRSKVIIKETGGNLWRKNSLMKFRCQARGNGMGRISCCWEAEPSGGGVG